jgi:hypothetical protein
MYRLKSSMNSNIRRPYNTAVAKTMISSQGQIFSRGLFKSPTLFKNTLATWVVSKPKVQVVAILPTRI